MLRQFDSVSGRLLLIGVCLRKLVVNGDFKYVCSSGHIWYASPVRLCLLRKLVVNGNFINIILILKRLGK